MHAGGSVCARATFLSSVAACLQESTAYTIVHTACLVVGMTGGVEEPPRMPVLRWHKRVRAPVAALVRKATEAQ